MTKKPKVLLITTDQQRFDTISALGNSKIKTPNLDDLVKKGVVFTRAYSSCPECVPARITIKTGMPPWQSGSTNNGEKINQNSETLMSVLAKNGYHTQAIGKMHFVPTRAKFGFKEMWLSEEVPEKVKDDEFLTELYKKGYSHAEEPHGMRSFLYYIPQVSQLPEKMHTTAWTGRKTVEYLNKRKRLKQPFFLWTSFIKPHPPFDPPVPFNSMYNPLDMELPIQEKDAAKNYTFWNYCQNRYKWMESNRNDVFLQTQKAFYYACISFVDKQLGLILSTLKKNGQLKNTVIIFTADHGEYLGDHFCFGKRGFQDSAARVPFIISYPAYLPKNTRIDMPVGHADIMPTVLDLCNVSHNKPQYGLTLIPKIKNHLSAERKYFYAQYNRKGYAVYMCMDSSWKYIFDVAGRREILYNFLKDPAEIKNLAGNSAYKKEKSRLKTELIKHFKEQGNHEAIKGNNFRPYYNKNYKRYKKLSSLNNHAKDGRLFQFALWTKRNADMWGSIF